MALFAVDQAVDASGPIRTIVSVSARLACPSTRCGVEDNECHLAEMLAEHIKGKAPADLLFPNSRGGYTRASNVRRRWWDAAVKESGVIEGLTLHELRHTAASLAITAGANIKTLRRMLGHASAALTVDRYGHLFDDDLGMVADQLDKLARPAIT